MPSPRSNPPRDRVDRHYSTPRVRRAARWSAFRHARADGEQPLPAHLDKISATEAFRRWAGRLSGLRSVADAELAHTQAGAKIDHINHRIGKLQRELARLEGRLVKHGEPLTGDGPGRMQTAFVLLALIGIDYLIFKQALQFAIPNPLDITLLALLLGVVVFGIARAIGGKVAALVEGWTVRKQHAADWTAIAIYLAFAMTVLIAVLIGANAVRNAGLSAVEGSAAHGGLLGELLLPAQAAGALWACWISFQRSRAERRSKLQADINSTKSQIQKLEQSLLPATLELNQAASRVGRAYAEADNRDQIERAQAANSRSLWLDKLTVGLRHRGQSNVVERIEHPDPVEVPPIKITYPDATATTGKVLPLPKTNTDDDRGDEQVAA